PAIRYGIIPRGIFPQLSMNPATRGVDVSLSVRWRRRLRFLRTRARELRMIAKALLSTEHPILVHIIPTRRCNLACTYCNEFDDFSQPVPLEEMKRRLDLLADMGTSVITISGGEPLLHPELDEIIRHIRRRGMIAGMITNGYLLTAERIGRLNRAGLEHLQISIDNAVPDEVSMKSLKVLDKKLAPLAKHALLPASTHSVPASGPDSRDASRGFRPTSTRRRCASANFSRQSSARRAAPSPACNRSAFWITGARHRI